MPLFIVLGCLKKHKYLVDQDLAYPDHLPLQLVSSHLRTHCYLQSDGIASGARTELCSYDAPEPQAGQFSSHSFSYHLRLFCPLPASSSNFTAASVFTFLRAEAARITDSFSFALLNQ